MKKVKSVVKSLKEPIVISTDTALGLMGFPIPAASSLSAIVNFVKYNKDQFLNVKIEEFLNDSSSITEEEKKLFLQKIDKEQEEFFKRLSLLIDRLDAKEKVKFLANLFKQTVKGKLTTNQFYSLSNIINQVLVDDLNFFERHYSSVHKSHEIIDQIGRDRLVEDAVNNKLLGLGLLKMSYKIAKNPIGLPQTNRPGENNNKITAKYSVTSLGRSLLDSCFKNSTVTTDDK